MPNALAAHLVNGYGEHSLNRQAASSIQPLFPFGSGSCTELLESLG